MRLQIVLALALTNVIFCSSSFARAGVTGGAFNGDTLDKASSQLHTLDHRAKAVEVSKKNAE